MESEALARIEARLEKQSEAIKALCAVVAAIGKSLEDLTALLFADEGAPDASKGLLILGERESALWHEAEAGRALRTTLYQMALAHAGELGKPVEIYTFDNKLLARVEQEVTH